MAAGDKALIQEARYSFPYHHLPFSRDGAWFVGRGLEWGYEYLALLETVTELLLESDPTKVLDFGCGDGRLIGHLIDRGCRELVGCDLSERALLFARAFCFDMPCRFYRRLDEVEDRDFDVAVAMEVLEHIPDSDLPTIVDGIASRLRSNGSFVVSVPTVNIPLQPKHYRHYTMSLLEQQLGERFRVEQVRWVHQAGFIANVVRRIVMNRLYLANSAFLLRMAAGAYNRWVRVGTPDRAHRLVLKLVKAR